MDEKSRVERELLDEKNSSREKDLDKEKQVEDQLTTLQMEVDRLNQTNKVISDYLYSLNLFSMNVFMYVCMYVRVFVSEFMYVKYACIYAYICVYVCVCMHI